MSQGTRKRQLEDITYCLASGVVATGAGAAASLVVTGSAAGRMVHGVTGALSIAVVLARESAPLGVSPGLAVACVPRCAQCAR
jgi:hypothetical protein